MLVEAEAGEFRDAELFLQDALRVVVLKGPVVNAAFHAAVAIEQRSWCGFEELRGARKKRFARTKELDFITKGLLRPGAGKLRALEFAGRKIDEREPDDAGGRVLVNGSKEIVLLGLEYGRICGRAGSDHADDFAAD